MDQDAAVGGLGSGSKKRTALYKATLTFAVLWFAIGVPGIFILIYSGDRMLRDIGVNLFGSLTILCFALIIIRETVKAVQQAIARQRARRQKASFPFEAKTAQVTNLERLWMMKQSGAITDDEYNTAKSKLLEQITSE